VKGFGWALKIMSHLTALVNKAFGSLSYEMAISEYNVGYRTSTLVDSIKKTEMK
jgi:UDP-glucose 4-epimerase